MATLIFFQVKTLAFQNQKLGHRLTQRIAMEEDLRSRIDQVCALYSYFFYCLHYTWVVLLQLEKRQTQDDALINIIHRYWNQLNEDIR